MTDIETIQWFFDLEKVSQGFNWPVNASGLADAKRQLDSVISGKAAADEVLDAYKKFAGAVGPGMMNVLLQSDDAFPEVSHCDKPTAVNAGSILLYVDPSGDSVQATPTTVWGAAPELFIR